MSNMTNTMNKGVTLFMAIVLVLSMTLSFAGMSLGTQQQEVTLNENGVNWEGQILQYTHGDETEVGETAEVRLVDGDSTNLVQELTVDEDGVSVEIDTFGFEPANYVLESNGNELTAFEVSIQTFAVSVDEEVVDNDAVGDSEATFEFDSNRASFDVLVSADGMDVQDDLVPLFTSLQTGEFSVYTDEDEDEFLRLEGVDSSSYELVADFDGQDAGDYAFNFVVFDTLLGDESAVSVLDFGSSDGSFSESLTSVTAGDVAEIEVLLENTNSATVTVGDDDAIGYEYTFDVVDVEGDNAVTFYFDTWNAGQDDGTTVVFTHEDSDDEIQNKQVETTLSADRQLAPGIYDVSLSMPDGRETALAALNIEPASESSILTHVVPGVEVVEEVEDLGAATVRDFVSQDDQFVVQIDANGIYSKVTEDTQVADLYGEASTLAVQHGIYVEMTEVSNTPNSDNSPVPETVFSTVIVNAEDEQVFLVGDASPLSDGDYTVDFYKTEDNPYIDEDADVDEGEVPKEHVSAELEVEEVSVEFENMNNDDVVVFEGESAEEVVAETNVAPGTEATLVLRITGEAARLDDRELTVSEEGILSDTFDLSEVRPGTEFEIEVRGLMPGPEDAIIRMDESDVDDEAPEDVESFPVNVTVVDESGDAVSATVFLGEFTADTEDGLAVFEEVPVGEHPLEISASGYQDYQEFFVVPEDVEEGAVETSVTLLESEPEPEPEPLPEPEPEPEPENDTESDDVLDGLQPEEEFGEDDEGPGQAGFGVIVAIGALLGAALLARRRN